VGKRRLTNDREVHLEAHKLEELEAVHVRHVDVADHKVKLVLLLPQQLQGRGCLSRCCHCGITNPDSLAHKSKPPGGTHYTCGITRLRGKLARTIFFLPLNKTRPRWRSEMDRTHKFTEIAQLAVGKALEGKIVLNIAVCQRMVKKHQTKSDQQSQTRLLFAEERR
jgi:hypothetical protein